MVHMSSDETAVQWAANYGMADVVFLSDPQRKIYRAFGLARGSPTTVLGLSTFVRGFQTAILKGHGMGVPDADPRQMPGVFLVWCGRIIRSFIHRRPADRPDYLALARLPG